MGVGDGTVIGATKIVDHGPDSSCYNIVLIAEGYRASEQSIFDNDCQDFVDRLNSTRPFNDCNSGVNVHKINISSTDSGADDPHTSTCGGAGTTAATYLDASFCSGGLERLMSFNGTIALNLLNTYVPPWHKAIIIVNTSKYGGAGGQIAITSNCSSWLNISIHEFGHGFGLADEYEYWYGCGLDDASHNHHSATEPLAPNVTIESSRDHVKWRNLILATTPVPTTTNADCAQCDPQPDPMATPGTVGLYEGGHYCHCGVYRPAFNCMMRNYAPFCGACENAIRQALSPFTHEADLAITPWGYAHDPPTDPLWQTPDIWGSPIVGEAHNDLHVRIHNLGNKTSGPYTVRLSCVPYTTVIDLANELLIGEFARPPVGPSPAIDEFVVNWDLSPAVVPPEFATTDHFCVLARIEAVECNTTNNSAQNNFADIPVHGPPPPPLYIEIANPWDHLAVAKLVCKASDRRVKFKLPDLDPESIRLKPHERRVLKIKLSLPKDSEALILKKGFSFKITQLLDGQTLGGVTGNIYYKAEKKVTVKKEVPRSARIKV
jgi:hypothetical protein